jgi:hypothetical protein
MSWVIEMSNVDGPYSNTDDCNDLQTNEKLLD